MRRLIQTTIIVIIVVAVEGGGGDAHQAGADLRMNGEPRRGSLRSFCDADAREDVQVAEGVGLTATNLLGRGINMRCLGGGLLR